MWRRALVWTKVVYIPLVCAFIILILLLDRAKWTRSLHFNNQSFSLNIEMNDRPSHWIINYIFETLLRERYGYRNINFIYTPWDSSSNAIDRLNCEKSKNCSLPPPIHVNLEVWLRTGEHVSDFAPSNRVHMNGPLGPITRWGLYANEELWNHYSPVRTPLFFPMLILLFQCRSYLLTILMIWS